MERTVIVWERESFDFGSKHIWEKHRVTEEEVEQVLFEVPPHVEARRHADHENRTVFWGATRYDRWIVVVCEDWNEGGTRFLRPITAFEPEEGTDGHILLRIEPIDQSRALELIDERPEFKRTLFASENQGADGEFSRTEAVVHMQLKVTFDLTAASVLRERQAPRTWGATIEERA